MSLNVTPLELEQVRKLANEDGSLYVINYTDRGRERNRGVFHIQAMDEAGTPIAIVVPNTWIPVDLSLYGSVKQMMKSQSFMTAFRNGDILCISSEEARRILDTAAAKEEQRKVNLKYNKSSVDKGSTQVSINTSSSTNINNIPVQPSDKEDENEINWTASDDSLFKLVDQFNQNKVADEDAVARLQGINPPPQDEAIKQSLMKIKFTTSPFYISLAELIGSTSNPDMNKQEPRFSGANT